MKESINPRSLTCAKNTPKTNRSETLWLAAPKEGKHPTELHGPLCPITWGRGQLKCDGTRVEIRFRLSAKRMSPFKSAGASVQSTTGSRGVRISGSNGGYNMFRGSVKGTGYPLHSPVSPSLPLPASPCAITYQLVYISRNTDRLDQGWRTLLRGCGQNVYKFPRNSFACPLEL